MRYKPSAFFANFSLEGLVRRSALWKAENQLGIGGGGGGSAGNDSGAHGSNQARYHKSETFSGRIKSTSDERLDMNELLSLLKEEIEKEISGRGAVVTTKGELDASGFYLEYGEEGIQGRLEISCKVAGQSCNLKAEMTETSTSTRQPVVERKLRRCQPAGNYYVVVFTQDDLRASTSAFYDTARAAIEDSQLRLRQKLIAVGPSNQRSLIESLLPVEVYVITPVSPEMKERWQEVFGSEYDVPAEYEQYERVYFLNEAARGMYLEAGEKFEVLKIISAEEVSKIPGPSLRGPYLPKDV